MNMSILFANRRLASACFALLLALCAAFAARPASAIEMANLYTAEANYDRQRRDGRERAYRDALNTVLRRLTTADAVAQARGLVEKPSQYVLGWSEVSAGKLLVSFDGVAITDVLRSAGFPVWGSERPLTLVWLAVEGLDGQRELVGATVETPPEAPSLTDDGEPVQTGPDLREQWLDPLQSASSLRGVPVRFPLLDEQDRDAVTGSDIWGGFDDVVMAASRRDGVDSVLIGRARQDRPAATRWTWLFAGERVSFSGDIERAVSRVSASLVEQFASSPDASADVRLSVVGVAGQRGFGRLSRYLATQSLIERVRVVAMRNDEILFELDALADRQRLAQILDGDVLERIEAQLPAPVRSFTANRPTDAADRPTDAAEATTEFGSMEEPADTLLAGRTAGFDDADLYFRMRVPGEPRRRP